MGKLTTIILFVVLILAACEKEKNHSLEPLPLQPIECDRTFEVCEDDSTQCCQVYCWSGYHNCGENATECCMDTSNHDLSLSYNAIGEYWGSIDDIDVAGDNDFWFCGRMVLDGDVHGLGHWDNGEFTYYQLLVPPYGMVLSAYGLKYISDTEIWLAIGSIYRWNGFDTERIHRFDLDGPVTHVSGIYSLSDDEMYMYGMNGTLVFCDRQEITQLPRLTDTTLKSATGTGADDIWISGWKHGYETCILHFDGNDWTKWYSIDDPDSDYWSQHRIIGPITGIWTDSPDYLWVVTYYAVYQVNSQDPYDFTIYWYEGNHWDGFIRGMTGTESGDFYIYGDYDVIWHWNGENFHRSGSYPAVISNQTAEYTGDKLYLGGFTEPSAAALITIGDRNLDQ